MIDGFAAMLPDHPPVIIRHEVQAAKPSFKLIEPHSHRVPETILQSVIVEKPNEARNQDSLKRRHLFFIYNSMVPNRQTLATQQLINDRALRNVCNELGITLHCSDPRILVKELKEAWDDTRSPCVFVLFEEGKRITYGRLTSPENLISKLRSQLK